MEQIYICNDNCDNFKIIKTIVISQDLLSIFDT